jgi:hypothetical protein
VIQLVWTGVSYGRSQTFDVSKVTVDELNPLSKVLRYAQPLTRHTPGEAGHVIPLLQQKLGKE